MTGAEILAFKNALLSPPTNPAIVVGSSNGRVYGWDGVDRILTAADAGAGWIVVDRGPYKLLFTDGKVYQSVGGFVGGAATVRPRAGDELEVAIVDYDLDVQGWLTAIKIVSRPGEDT